MTLGTGSKKLKSAAKGTTMSTGSKTEDLIVRIIMAKFTSQVSIIPEAHQKGVGKPKPKWTNVVSSSELNVAPTNMGAWATASEAVGNSQSAVAKLKAKIIMDVLAVSDD